MRTKILVLLVLSILLFAACATPTPSVKYAYAVPEVYQNDLIDSTGRFEFTNPDCIVLEPKDVIKVQYDEEQHGKYFGIKITYISTSSRVYVIPFLIPETNASGTFMFGQATFTSQRILGFSGQYLVPVDSCPEN